MADFFTVQGRTFSVVGKLGEGSFAMVFAARDEAGERVAIKRGSALEQEDIDASRREIEIMTRISHTCIVPALAAEVKKRGDTRVSFIAMPHAEHGNLVAVVNRHLKSDKVMSEKLILTAVQSVASGVAELHSLAEPMAHRDLKAENVLCFGPFDYKICDFGSSTVFSFQCTNGKDIGFVEDDLNRKTTLAYRAPEQCALMSKLRMDQRVDNWAIGVVLYLLCFFECPFPDSSVAITQATYTIPQSRPSLSSETKELIRFILVKDADARPTAQQIYDRVTELLGALYPSHPTSVPQAKPPSERQQVQHPSLGRVVSATASPRASGPAQQAKPAPKKAGLFGMLDWAEGPGGAQPAQPKPTPNLFTSAAAPAAQPVTAQSLFASPPSSAQPSLFGGQPPAQQASPQGITSSNDFFSSLQGSNAGSPASGQSGPPPAQDAFSFLDTAPPAPVPVPSPQQPQQQQQQQQPASHPFGALQPGPSQGSDDLFPSTSPLDVLTGIAQQQRPGGGYASPGSASPQQPHDRSASAALNDLF